MKREEPRGLFLHGMIKALSSVLTSTQQQRADDIKEEGKRLFLPQLGGDYSTWRARPLHPALIRYAAEDVVHFFKMYDAWRRTMAGARLREISELRMHKTIARPEPWARDGSGRSKWARVDFKF